MKILKSLDELKSEGIYFWDLPTHNPSFSFPIYADGMEDMSQYFINKYCTEDLKIGIYFKTEARFKLLKVLEGA